MKEETNYISVLSNKERIIFKIKEIAPYDGIKNELKTKLVQLKKFYQDEKFPIYVTGKLLKIDEVKELKKLISKYLDVPIEFDSPLELGLSGIKKNYKKDIETSQTKFIKSSIRSGQKIEFEGSIVILGDVNGGAEIIAEDNIVVLGKLRGMAHAGAKGNEQAIIAAKSIDSRQIRIASNIKERTQEEVDTQFYQFAYINESGEIELTF